MLKTLVVTLLAAVSLTQPAFALLPPGAIAYNELMASIGADPCVKASEPDSYLGNATVTLTVCDATKAQALANVLQQNVHNLGELRVADAQGNILKPEKLSDFIQLAQAAYTAFQNNPYYKKAYPYSPLGVRPNCTLVEFKPQVIQVAEDNIGNPYGSNSYVAADVFALFLDADAGGVADALRVVTGPAAK